jgi:peptide/nickel transport system ATP-binding protein
VSASAALGDSPVAGGEAERDIVLACEGLSVDYDGDPVTHAVRDVTLELHRGEVLGIAGESGCGKSTLAYALTRLLRPPAQRVAGSIRFWPAPDAEPIDLTTLPEDELRPLRWSQIAMVFQSAMNALNPVTRLSRQFDDIFAAHLPGTGAGQRRARAEELLGLVELEPTVLDRFPHELSGGMRQRVVIAMALALDPSVVVMDEPTTALDVVVQREILDQIERLREQLGFSVIFITHDLSLLLEVADRLAVMYAGRVVELADAAEVRQRPAHPYTLGLLSSFPDLRGVRRDLHGIPGSPPDLSTALTGCAFAPRCGYRFDACDRIDPPLQALGGPRGGARSVACHLHEPGCGRAPAELRAGVGT